MEAVAIVTALAVLQLFWFAFLVGKERVKHGVHAPAMSGHQDFERACRVHQNTAEQLIILLPGLWLFAYYVHPLIAAGLGAVFIVGRMIYRSGYLADPSKRSTGFGLGALPMVVLVLGGLIGAALRLF